jgi:hypothetical protein
VDYPFTALGWCLRVELRWMKVRSEYRLSALTEPPDGGDYCAPGSQASQASQDEGPETGAVACLRVEVAFKLVIFQPLREQVTLVSDSYSRGRWRWRGR